MERVPKFEPSKQPEAVATTEAEIITLADWRQARESAPQVVAERVPGLLESDPSPEKVTALRSLLDTLSGEIEDVARSRAEQRLAYYAAEEVARVLAETELIVSEEQVLVRNERGELPDVPPAEYGGVVQFVPREKRQYLSPANDNRLADPALYGT